MISISYPDHSFKIRELLQGKEEIWDELRRSWVRLTPEEWVRQNFIQYLLKVQTYPPSNMAVERMIRLGELKKRFDLLVFDRNAQPWMMVECKAINERLDQRVLWQVLRYNMALPVKYLVITNGEECHLFVKGHTDFDALDAFPAWPGADLTAG